MKIALTGPESTGKTNTAFYLAAFFNAVVVEEMARKYIDQLGRPYEERDLLEIAKMQCAEEDRLSGSKLIICDTTLMVIKVWSEYRYGRCDPWIEKEYRKRKYRLHLLCHIDIPWQRDDQREHANAREELFNIYHNELIQSGAPYEILTGLDEKRKAKAVEFVKKVLI